jgi:hypothetical protein
MYQKQKVIVYDKHVCDKNKNILYFDKQMSTKNTKCLPSEKWWIKNGSKTFVYQNKNICV